MIIQNAKLFFRKWLQSNSSLASCEKICLTGRLEYKYRKLLKQSLGTFSRKCEKVSWICNQNVAVLNVIANYVHKTCLNGIVVLIESYNIWLLRVKILKESLRLTFRNIGLNINWCGVLFCFLSKIAPNDIKWGVN